MEYFCLGLILPQHSKLSRVPWILLWRVLLLMLKLFDCPSLVLKPRHSVLLAPHLLSLGTKWRRREQSMGLPGTNLSAYERARGRPPPDASKRLNWLQLFCNSRLTQQAFHLDAEDALKELCCGLYARMTTRLLYSCHHWKRGLLSAFSISLRGFALLGKPSTNTDHTWHWEGPAEKKKL